MVVNDPDDPAIWINKEKPSESLIIGTDKPIGGGLYAFDLQGKIIKKKSVLGMQYMNNVDIAYGLLLNGKPTDIAVATEREVFKIRVVGLPAMKLIDNGGIRVFENEKPEESKPMGIALYKRPKDEAIFAIVSRKKGPTEGYLWQYLLSDDGNGQVKATLVRKFGKYSGKKEIESVAVDNELGYVYYSDEQVGVRKYYADPDLKNDDELALFATKGFTEDNEGIGIYKVTAKTGYIVVSDQGANKIQIFTREGEPSNANEHHLLKTLKVSADQTDGLELTNVAVNKQFPYGFLVSMSSKTKNFHIFDWRNIAGKELKLRKR